MNPSENGRKIKHWQLIAFIIVIPLNWFPIVIQHTNKPLMIWKAKRNCLLNSNPLQSSVHTLVMYILKKICCYVYQWTPFEWNKHENIVMFPLHIYTILQNLAINRTKCWMLLRCDILLILKWEMRGSSVAHWEKYPGADNRWAMMKTYI